MLNAIAAICSIHGESLTSTTASQSGQGSTAKVNWWVTHLKSTRKSTRSESERMRRSPRRRNKRLMAIAIKVKTRCESSRVHWPQERLVDEASPKHAMGNDNSGVACPCPTLALYAFSNIAGGAKKFAVSTSKGIEILHSTRIDGTQPGNIDLHPHHLTFPILTPSDIREPASSLPLRPQHGKTSSSKSCTSNPPPTSAPKTST